MATEDCTPLPENIYKWADSIDRADETWNYWDSDISSAVAMYNAHLATLPGNMQLDWRLIKAMLWVETGPHKAAWVTRPMQIGNAGDKGLKELFKKSGAGSLIIPQQYKELTPESVRKNPVDNIKAGIGYLLIELSNSDFQSVPYGDIYEVKIKKHDNFAKIAKAEGTTVEELELQNPGVRTLHAGDVVKCRKATMQRVITGWKQLSLESVARLYNSGINDPDYVVRLRYAYANITGESQFCTR